MPEWVPINWGIIKSPLNWAIILLMVIFFGVFVDIFISVWAPSKGDSQ